MTKLPILAALALSALAGFGAVSAFTMAARGVLDVGYLCYVATDARGDAYVAGSGSNAGEAMRNARLPANAVEVKLVACDHD